MKAYFLPFLVLFALVFAGLANAQDTDKEIETALRQANEAAKKMGVQMPDVKKMMAEDAQEEAKEQAKAKAKLQAAISAPGPVAFPNWTPNIPEFTPAGPVGKKIVDDVAQIVQTGTSPLSPVALADEWEKFKNDKYQFSRMRSNINETITQTVTFRELEDPHQEVTMKATRAPGKKSRTSRCPPHCRRPPRPRRSDANWPQGPRLLAISPAQPLADSQSAPATAKQCAAGPLAKIDSRMCRGNWGRQSSCWRDANTHTRDAYATQNHVSRKSRTCFPAFLIRLLPYSLGDARALPHPIADRGDGCRVLRGR